MEYPHSKGAEIYASLKRRSRQRARQVRKTLSAEILGAFSSILKRTCGQANAKKAGGDVGRRNELNAPADAPALLGDASALLADADACRCPTCLRGTTHALHLRAAAACALERTQAASLQPLASRAV